MTAEWTKKDERQYEHIKKSAKKRGKETERAKEIAARTVNKQRRSEGRTPKKVTSGSGNPNRELDDRTVEELRTRARQLSINNYSSMRKKKLIQAIRRAA